MAAMARASRLAARGAPEEGLSDGLRAVRPRRGRPAAEDRRLCQGSKWASS